MPLRRSLALPLVLACLIVGCTAAPVPPTPEPPPAETHLAVGVGFEDLDDAEHLARHLDEVGAAGVTLAVGRPDWVAFDWTAHPDAAASEEDRVAAALAKLGVDGEGRAREVTLVIDTLAPRMIEADPGAAGVDAKGRRSDLLPGAAAYLSGDIGRRVVELCGTVAERYRPQRVALTELILDATFSDADLVAFRALTGRADWPRDDDGDLDPSSPAIAEFKARVAADLTSRCAGATHPHGVAVDVDVRANWDDPSRDRRDSGHDYARLLAAGDHLTVWNYFPLNDRSPAYSREITAGLGRQLGADGVRRVTMSVGLWAGKGGDHAENTGRDGVLAPQAMAAGVEDSLTNGVTRVSVTPASLMSHEHWAALKATGVGR